MKFADWNIIYLVGIKGVAMTAIAQLLHDAGKTVMGCDVDEDFVTQEKLAELGIDIDSGFSHPIPDSVDGVIYTAAHGGEENAVVSSAKIQNLPVLSHAEALAELFNAKKDRVAVCGVGGKSTVSAMISWIFEGLQKDVSYSVGVGEIIGLGRSARWTESSSTFVTEADEYATNPEAVKRGANIVPRFFYFSPTIIVATHISYDHPDVYPDFDHTLVVFQDFFGSLSSSGLAVVNSNDLKYVPKKYQKTAKTVGTDDTATMRYAMRPEETHAGTTAATLIYDGKEYALKLKVPGTYNVENAAFAILTCQLLGISIEDAIGQLESFKSTKRRFESHGIKNDVTYYDDYAHHPDEIKAAVSALGQWYPDAPKIVAFQPHTYSRTQTLLHEFSHVLGQVENLLLLDIFASARETDNKSISIQDLKKAIVARQTTDQNSQKRSVTIVSDYTELASHLESVEPGSIVLTLGAGDIYKVHDLILG